MSGSHRIHYRDICPDCGKVGESLGLVEIEEADSDCVHHRCDDCGAEWYCPTGRTRNQDTGGDSWPKSPTPCCGVVLQKCSATWDCQYCCSRCGNTAKYLIREYGTGWLDSNSSLQKMSKNPDTEVDRDE